MMHEHLMRGVRGQDKKPGRFRDAQNWIGPKGCTIEQATYVPPSPLRLYDHLEAFESFLQDEHPDLDPIVKAALIHAQFEKNRDIYTARLTGISETGDWRSWIRFFLDAVVGQSETNLEMVFNRPVF